ncbi:universal stress protein [Polaribacter reichenbachii]|uniref:Universal stress protein n=1 Tax=Polaribacter reichenbachii TaxID=996801 RepID=A0A1B8U2S8_9FLAO|nr:universal stress protein [Polaribacter reichenbachii]APZ47947.1 universal stress protein [Polaribacter reichenbachii]AUC18580.1 universal stress protein [Polaribacter reichenbachii]OBY66089.1 universal stress protein [Polaribacter reichenbachii]
MEKILVPIDFSKKSEFASKMAARIAKESNSIVYLLHMIELPTGVVDMGAGSKFSIPESMLYLRKVRERMLEFKEKFFHKKTEVHHIIKLQQPHEGILEYADKIDADLIVMGSKGHSKFEEILIGSNTEKVVRTSKVPVIVVKRDNEKFRMRNLVFASSFKNEDKKAVFKKFLDFANHFKSEIHLLKVNTPSRFESTQEAKEKITNFIKDFDLPKYSINIYNDATINKGILNFSRDIDADLIALSTHGRSGLSHIFSASVTKTLSKKALKPILTIKV